MAIITGISIKSMIESIKRDLNSATADIEVIQIKM